jgi:hypothetical protein
MKAETEPIAEPTGEGDERQRYATFTLEFLLDEESQTRRTRVVHIQSGNEQTWAGWQEGRLINFLTRRARPAHANPQPPDHQGQAGQPRLTKIEILSTTGGITQHLLHDGQNFEAQLTLDLSRVAIPEDQSLGFAATIYARNMADGSQQVIGKRRGAVAPAAQTVIPIPNLSLPAGMYRVEAAIQLSWLSEEPYYQVVVEGNLLQVYG